MNLLVIIKVALRSIRGNKLRTFLTVLGIVIGVMSVISMLALGAGTREKITQQVRNNGANLFSVRPGYRPAASGVRTGTYNNLKIKDAEAILEQVPEIEMVCPDTDDDYIVKHMSHNARVQVNGEAITYFVMRNCQIASGRAFTEEEVIRHARLAVIGPKTAQNLFPGEDPLGERIKIKGINFLVIGVAKSKDDRADDNVWIPYTTAMAQLQGSDALHQIYCRVRSEIPMQDAIEKASNVMRKRHVIQAGQPDDFSIRNNQEMAESLDQVSTIFTTLLAGIAGISLFIGGINIMNIMLVTVTERTREIGLRKALGARQIDLLTQFLLEAVILSMSGGLIGVLLGVGTVLVFNFTTEQMTGAAYGAILELTPIVVSFGFSLIVGIFFGWYPAKKASRLNPIDALRYE